jgi:hypothetical protein
VTMQECLITAGNQPAFSRDLNALLPGYFSSLLNLASQHSLLPAILKAMHVLIPEHSNAFRPSSTSANSLLSSIFDGNYSSEVKKLAARVYVDLHHSASKGANSEYWRSSILGVVGETHLTLNTLFHCIKEGRHSLE